MEEPRRWPPEAWVPLLAGLYWLWSAPTHGVLGFLFSVVPGCLLLGAGVTMLLMPGDLRISQFAALGGVAGVVFAIPSLFVVGLGHGLLLMLASAAGFVAAGWHTLALEPHPEGVPRPPPGISLAAQLAIDETLLSTWTLSLPLVFGAERDRIGAELRDARALFAERGWLERPEQFHLEPPPLEAPSIQRRELRGLAYEHLCFESGYAPHDAAPGRDRWLSYAANRTAHAWVVRGSGEARPWVVCIHGYQMGSPTLDLHAFQVARLHRELGLDVALLVLPLHGPRKMGRRSGDGFLSGEVMDTVHAEAQGVWDLRRLLSWIRGQGASRIGVHGMSLGGYNAALLSSLDDRLACVVAGIPATDFARLMFRHGPPLQVRMIEMAGLDDDVLDDVLRPVSPLALQTTVPFERRAIYAGTADRIVPAEQVRDLWRHWGEPSIEWYPGAHCTFGMHPGVRELTERTLREALCP